MIVNILMLYVIMSYLIYASFVLTSWNDLSDNARIGGIILLIIAPISLPISLGVYFAANVGR